MKPMKVAADNDDAMKRVADRLKNDVGIILSDSIRNHRTPFWALARMLFPIAESLSDLLGYRKSGTSQGLSEFFNKELVKRNARYADTSHIICQIWRHGLTHGDEPPALAMKDSKGVNKVCVWRVILNSSPDHLKVSKVKANHVQVTFSLEDFYNDLLCICTNRAVIQAKSANDVADRYNQWTVKNLGNNRKEEKLAAAQIDKLVP